MPATVGATESQVMDMLNMGWNVVSKRWTPPSAHRRWPSWLPVAAALAAGVSLLLAFNLVVRQLVQDGESRRLAVATHSGNVWRCYALHGRTQRDACLSELNTVTNSSNSTSALAAKP